MNKRETVFLGIWLLQCVLTAVLTELYVDESYYWTWSRYLDWGYFDHPPAVAVSIALGQLFGKSELTVRLGAILFSLISFLIIIRMVRPKDDLTFYGILFGGFSFQLLGFMNTPDSPFWLFSVLLLLVYREYLKEQRWVYVILLGVTTAVLFYSKYIGLLVLVFLVLSNPDLFRQPRFYAAMVLAFVLFLPHVWWQYSNDFPSFRYHLLDRGGDSYRIGMTLEYILSSLFYHLGLPGIFLLIWSVRYKTKDLFEKALKFNLLGILLFFLYQSFRIQVKPNWTLFVALPMLYLGYKYYEEQGRPRKSLFRVVIATSVCFMLFFKIHLIHPLFVSKKDRVWDFHMNAPMAQKVDSLSGGRMITANRYQTASILNFYLDKDYLIPALNIETRANQYELWKTDSLICGKEILHVTKLPKNTRGDVMGNSWREYKTDTIDRPAPLKFLRVQFDSVKAEGRMVTLNVRVKRELDRDCYYWDRVDLEVEFYREDQLLGDQRFQINRQIQLAREVMKFEVQAPEEGWDEIRLRLRSGKLNGRNRYFARWKRKNA